MVMLFMILEIEAKDIMHCCGKLMVNTAVFKNFSLNGYDWIENDQTCIGLIQIEIIEPYNNVNLFRSLV